MLNKTLMTVVFPSGGGGHWLLSLINGLENPDQISYAPKNNNNYHHNPSTPNATVTHDHLATPAVFFNGSCAFNIYLNLVQKYLFNETKLHLAQSNILYDELASTADDKIMFSLLRKDLHYDWIYTDPTLFVHTLYTLLDQHNFVYTRNDQHCLTSISYFKNTCVNPLDHYDNWSSDMWLGWCNGINKNLNGDVLLYNNRQEIVDDLIQQRQFFCDFTRNLIINE
jgi:hypothetical protein